MYRIYHDFSKVVLNEIFTLRHQNQYNLRNWSAFYVRYFDPDHGSESVRYLGPMILEIIPKHINKSDTKDKLKIDTTKRKPEPCLCRLYNVY